MSADEMTAWLRAQVEADKAAARALIGGGCTGIWEIDRYRAVRDSGSPVRLFDGVVHDRATWRTVDVARAHHAYAQAEHVAVHDPRDVVADCEAKLRLLDLHQPFEGFGGGTECEACGPNNNDPADADIVVLGSNEFWPCATVRVLASGYRHRDGWQEAWACPS